MGINIERALKIDGQMWDAELQWLAEQASQHHCIVELGSYLGRSARALLDNSPGTVIAIDKFSPHGPEKRDWVLTQFLANTSDCPNLCVVVCDHRRIPPHAFRPDMVFIDGDHDYAAVCDDIQYWSERLLPGGLLCGHDCHGDQPGVDQAVKELLPGYVVADNTRIWIAGTERAF